MDHDIAVEEFTEESTLVPSDRITWTDSEDPEEGLESQGWTCCWRMEERAAPAGAPVSANIYVHIETGHVLVDLMVLGVRSWLLCRSRLAFLRLTRDWLSELTDLERHERVDSFLEDTTTRWPQSARVSRRSAVRHGGARRAGRGARLGGTSTRTYKRERTSGN